MNEKKQSGKKRLFLLVLVAFGIVLWIKLILSISVDR